MDAYTKRLLKRKFTNLAIMVAIVGAFILISILFPNAFH